MAEGQRDRSQDPEFKSREALEQRKAHARSMADKLRAFIDTANRSEITPAIESAAQQFREELEGMIEGLSVDVAGFHAGDLQGELRRLQAELAEVRQVSASSAPDSAPSSPAPAGGPAVDRESKAYGLGQRVANHFGEKKVAVPKVEQGERPNTQERPWNRWGRAIRETVANRPRVNLGEVFHRAGVNIGNAVEQGRQAIRDMWQRVRRGRSERQTGAPEVQPPVKTPEARSFLEIDNRGQVEELLGNLLDIYEDNWASIRENHSRGEDQINTENIDKIDERSGQAWEALTKEADRDILATAHRVLNLTDVEALWHQVLDHVRRGPAGFNEAQQVMMQLRQLFTDSAENLGNDESLAHEELELTMPSPELEENIQERAGILSIGQERIDALMEMVREFAARGEVQKIKDLLMTNPEIQVSLVSLIAGGALRSVAGVATAPLLAVLRQALEERQTPEVQERMQRKYRRLERVAPPITQSLDQPEVDADELLDAIEDDEVPDEVIEIPQESRGRRFLRRLGRGAGRGAEVAGRVLGTFVVAGERIVMAPNKKAKRIAGKLQEIHLNLSPEEIEAIEHEDTAVFDRAINKWLEERYANRVLQHLDKDTLQARILELDGLLVDLLDMQLMGDHVPQVMGARFLREKGDGYYENPAFIKLLRDKIMAYLTNEAKARASYSFVQRLFGAQNAFRTESRVDVRVRAAIERLSNIKNDEYRQNYLNQRAEKYLIDMNRMEVLVLLGQGIAAGGIVRGLLEGRGADVTEARHGRRVPGAEHTPPPSDAVPGRRLPRAEFGVRPSLPPAAEATVDTTPLEAAVEQKSPGLPPKDYEFNVDLTHQTNAILPNGTFKINGDGNFVVADALGYPTIDSINRAGLEGIQGIVEGTRGQIVNAANDLARSAGRTFTPEELTKVVDAFNGRYGTDIRNMMVQLGNTYEGNQNAPAILARLGIRGIK